MIKKIAEKIRNLITVSEITTTTSDEGLDSVGQVQFMNKTTDTAIVMPYGISANAPKDSNALTFSVGGSAQNKASIPYNSENRFTGLKEGEVKIGNFVTRCSIIFKEDGGVELVTGKEGGNIIFKNSDESGTFEITDDGKMILNGGTEKAVKGVAFEKSWVKHTHPTAFGPSGFPVALTPDNFNDTILL